MSGTESDEGRAAASALAHLLERWPADIGEALGDIIAQRGVSPASLLHASGRPAGPTETDGSASTWTRWSLARHAAPPSAPSPLPTAGRQEHRRFEDVVDAVASRNLGKAKPPATDGFGADGQHFAARIGAIETARAFDGSGSANPPEPDGCFERYRDIVDGLNEETEEDPGTGADLSAMFNANLMAFDNDDEEPAPASIGPKVGGVARVFRSEDDFGEPLARAVFI